MSNFREKSYRAFDMFIKEWALVTAGTMEDYNTCTIGWGTMGNIWGSTSKTDKPIITVFIHPARYTQEFMEKYDTFTVSFFSMEQRKALGYLGSHSGRDEDKVAASGLTPVAIGDTVTFKEASKTFVCRKLYSQQFEMDRLHPDIRDYYASMPQVYTQRDKDEWEPHYMYIGEVLEVK